MGACGELKRGGRIVPRARRGVFLGVACGKPKRSWKRYACTFSVVWSLACTGRCVPPGESFV